MSNTVWMLRASHSTVKEGEDTLIAVWIGKPTAANIVGLFSDPFSDCTADTPEGVVDFINNNSHLLEIPMFDEWNLEQFETGVCYE